MPVPNRNPHDPPRQDDWDQVSPGWDFHGSSAEPQWSDPREPLPQYPTLHPRWWIALLFLATVLAAFWPFLIHLPTTEFDLFFLWAVQAGSWLTGASWLATRGCLKRIHPQRWRRYRAAAPSGRVLAVVAVFLLFLGLCSGSLTVQILIWNAC